MVDFFDKWLGGEVEREITNIVDKVAKEGAEQVAKDAKAILMRKAKTPTGKLASQIKIKASKFRGGGYLVEAQGPGNFEKFYAIFVELGTHKMKKIPYLRPALTMNRRKILDNYRNRLK